MTQTFDTISTLTSSNTNGVNDPILLKRFANEFGWNPSYYLSPTEEKSFTNIHLVVEHGLENSAMISFLSNPYNDLSNDDRRLLLNLSYNNLVDWHINIERNKITYVHNRYDPSDNVIEEFIIKRDSYDSLRSDAFERIIGKKSNPNITALDDALIDTISHWKRIISSELNNQVSLEELSSFFNSIIFTRAVEDNLKRLDSPLITNTSKNWLLLESIDDLNYKKNKFTGILEQTLANLGQKVIPKYLIDFQELRVFNNLEVETIKSCLRDFYENRHFNFYSYDFSIISQHALSRIYEKYISILRYEKTLQLSFLPSIPDEIHTSETGAVYTPQYIARFFAKYLMENLPPVHFKNLKVMEPAVGSGIFLRSLLELQCDPRYSNMTDPQIENSFQNIFGIDIDRNAQKATFLSLALLQLVLTRRFPKKLDIIDEDAIKFYIKHPEIKGTFDSVITNPPFIPIDKQSQELRNAIKEFMQDLGHGRIDTYLAFLKLGFELLKPGGFGLFVLPHSFLVSQSGKSMRKLIAEQCWIRCLADLSAIQVFQETDIYVILLIFQKKQPEIQISPDATLIKCRDFVGRALQDALNRNFKETDFYSIYEVDQDFFQKGEWHVLPSSEIQLAKKLETFPSLDNFMVIREGFVSGYDEVFIVDQKVASYLEKEIFVPYIPDKEMTAYSIKKSTAKCFFYPFIDGEKIDELTLKKKFPKTWNYLMGYKQKLISKNSFQKDDWWRPHRPKSPTDMMRPKIISPHLTITPKFSYDQYGRFAVSRTPFIIPKKDSFISEDILYYFLAVLNSSVCFWYISNHSHKYGGGYIMLEVKTLRKTTVPDPSTVPINQMQRIINLVKTRIQQKGLEAIETERMIDMEILNLYGLSKKEKQLFELI